MPASTTRPLVKSLILALDIDVAPVTSNVPPTVALLEVVTVPVIFKSVPLKVMLLESSTSPLEPAIRTLLSVKSVTRKLPTATSAKEPLITEEVSVASAIIINSEALSS